MSALRQVSLAAMSSMIVRGKSSFVCEKSYVNGEWVNSSSGDRFDVFNPATEKVIVSLPDMEVNDVEKAVQAAKIAFNTWQNTTAKSRGVLLRKWYELINANSEDLAKILTAEMGKPLAEARGEIAYGASFVDWFAEEARRTYGETIPSPSSNKRIITIKQPIGVTALVTPWNFPSAMFTRKVAPALAAGCTVIVKPSEDTPLSSLALCLLAEKAGIPPGVINVVTCSRSKVAEIGRHLTEHPNISKISFTGSTAIGKLILQQAATTIKAVSMELGGNAPFIVFDSADLEKAIEGAMLCKFRATGQTCVCANRILVQDSIYDQFIDGMKKSMATLKMGDGFDPDVNQGPLINEEAILKVERHVSDAISLGAKLVVGGNRKIAGKLFYEPTLLAEVNSEMMCGREEIFGPVAPIFRFKTEEEALKIANETSSGLAGYFYSNDISQIWRVAEKMQVGMVGINEGIISATEAPFGGIKQSGLGREGSCYGLDEYLEVKYLCFGGLV